MNSFIIPKQRYDRQLYYIFEHKKHQWFEEEGLVKIQEQKLNSLINHAYKNVPFYHDLFDSVGIKPHNVRTVKDLQKIPILTKEVIRNNYPDKIIAKDVDITNCRIRSTTGSTGMPLKVAFSPKMEDYAKGLTFFVWSECGLRLKDKFVLIYHRSIQIDLFKRLLQKIGILRWKSISIFNPIESIVESLKDFKPDVISTYPSMLMLLSRKIREQKIDGIKPRLIITSGETMTDNNRNKICQVFNSDIYCLYGSEECSRLAFECEKHSGYHIIGSSAIIEFVKEGRNVAEGEQGDIVVTSLFNYSMPLIRYNIGDIGTFTKEKCTCGRGLPLIKSIEGRTDDFLILPSGRKISPRMINVIEDIPGVSMYKTIQETKKRIIVNLVQGKGFDQETINEIKKHIKAGCLGEHVEVDVKLVKELPLEKRGKLRAIVSYVKE